MRSKIFLADSAEVRVNLLFLLGGAWTQVGPNPQPFAIAGLIEVDWDEANEKHSIEFAIDDEDGNPLLVPSATGNQPFRIRHQFEVGRPAGAPRGTTFHVPVALPIPPIPWTAGRRYVVIVRIDGNEHDRVRFSVRPMPAPVVPSEPEPPRQP
jgi:hypothetical protein